MNIRLAKKEDAAHIAEIHRKEIKTGFLSSLPPQFLAILYEAIIRSPGGFCVVADTGGGSISGFVSGVASVRNFYRYFFLHYFFQAAFLLFPRLFRFSVVQRIFENVNYPQESRMLSEAELLTIAVLENLRGQGIAALLLERFVQEMRTRNINAFKVVVGEKLERAIRFYEKSGFEFQKVITLHGKEISRVYIYRI